MKIKQKLCSIYKDEFKKRPQTVHSLVQVYMMVNQYVLMYTAFNI